jgi:hypothetical protein
MRRRLEPSPAYAEGLAAMLVHGPAPREGEARIGQGIVKAGRDSGGNTQRILAGTTARRALGMTAILVYIPFAQRSLVLMSSHSR